MTQSSALYLGRVTHQRLRPRRHTLAYRAYWLLLDLDEMAALAGRLRLFSHNRFNLFAFHDTDHGTGAKLPLRATIESELANVGIDLRRRRHPPARHAAPARLRLQSDQHLFLLIEDGPLDALIYEVHNTFRQRHSYVHRRRQRRRRGPAALRKALLRLALPRHGHALRFQRDEPGRRRPRHRARLRPRRRPDRRLAVRPERGADRRAAAEVFFSHPLLTLKVTAAIHCEALLLWLKGLRLRPRPRRPSGR